MVLSVDVEQAPRTSPSWSPPFAGSTTQVWLLVGDPVDTEPKRRSARAASRRRRKAWPRRVPVVLAPSKPIRQSTRRLGESGEIVSKFHLISAAQNLGSWRDLVLTGRRQLSNLPWWRIWVGRMSWRRDDPRGPHAPGAQSTGPPPVNWSAGASNLRGGPARAQVTRSHQPLSQGNTFGKWIDSQQRESERVREVPFSFSIQRDRGMALFEVLIIVVADKLCRDSGRWSVWAPPGWYMPAGVQGRSRPVGRF